MSGHACQEEIKLIYSLVKPKYAIPIHGEYRHLTAQKHIVEDLGIPKENIFILSSGNVLELDGQDAKVTGSVHTGAIFVDGKYRTSRQTASGRGRNYDRSYDPGASQQCGSCRT